MLFNFLVFLFVALITGYLTTQGMLSAFLALVSATFASILAMGLMEPLEDLTAKWHPDMARGLTLLVVFLVTFAVLRVVADLVVPKNIKIPRLANRVAGGFLGFFTGLIVMGTVVAGIEMMPLPRSLLGFDRFSGENGMYDKDRPGEVSARQSGIFFGADRFVMAIWSAASGRSLGGQYYWGQIHPDLAVESYGYRNTGAIGSKRTVPQGNFAVMAAWMSNDPKEYGNLGIKTSDPDRPVVMIRTQVTNGGGGRRGGFGRGGGSGAAASGESGAADVPEKGEESGGPFFRITPTQIRLVTDKGNQYYPIGYMDQGRVFTALPLDSGRVVDDFVNGVATEDWIFQVKSGEEPAFLEMKELARTDFAKVQGFVKTKPTAPLAVAQYPKKPYLGELSTLAVTVDLMGKKLQEGKVYVLTPTAAQKEMDSAARSAFNHVQSVLEDMEVAKGGWSAQPKPGVKGRDFFEQEVRMGRDHVIDEQPPTQIDWSLVLPLLLAGDMGPDGQANVQGYPDFFRNKLEPLWHNVQKGDAILHSAMLDEKGGAELTKINPGRYLVVTAAKTDRGFFVWMNELEFKASTKPTVNLSVDHPDFSVDLDTKAPAPPGAATAPAP